MDDLEPELKEAWLFVGKGNDQALVTFYKGGDLNTAFAEFDRIRDEGIEMAAGHPKFQNELECRRFEFRISAAFHTGDHDLICRVLQEAGASRRFDTERLHYFLEVIGGMIRDLGKAKQ